MKGGDKEGSEDGQAQYHTVLVPVPSNLWMLDLNLPTLQEYYTLLVPAPAESLSGSLSSSDRSYKLETYLQGRFMFSPTVLDSVKIRKYVWTPVPESLRSSD